MADPREEKDSDSKKDISDFKEVCEGKAKILFPVGNTVFYNNVQVFNRDLSVAVIKLFAKEFKKEKEKKKKSQRKNDNDKPDNVNPVEPSIKISVLEALSASGLRAIRYSLEIADLTHLIANDLSKEAVKSIERNINHNCVAEKVKSSLSDACVLMYQNKFPLWKRYSIIDLDPYGSPCQFLDGAVQAVDDGGLLCVTCTDMGGLCGNHGEAAFAKYGCMPLKAKYCHEMALRIILASIDTHAGRYKRYIVPLLSLSADFYIRVFVRVYTSAAEVKRSASKKSYIFHCNGCESFHFQPVGKSVEVGDSKKFNPASGPPVGQTCIQCGYNFKIGGPVWSDPIHDTAFLANLQTEVTNEKESYATYDRINGVLSIMQEELADRPLYYVLDSLCNTLHSVTPSHAQFRSALLHAGYKVSSTHAHESGIKTDAPTSVIWDILRCWVKLHPINRKKITERAPAHIILEKDPELEASFEILKEATPKSKQMKLTRFPINPEADWGPKARAKQSTQFSSLAEKRHALQGKRTLKKTDPDFHKQFPCKRFKRGECELGTTCKYNHPVTKDGVGETREKDSKGENPLNETEETPLAMES
ncbi:tRNA (guanine(26)-N(2))-dimethyltransferase-like [Clytia hemisphaerica]|uniref:tRNA (guanine(26)-N(2))-dimethyltransferase n=1 Tax=Clytia hemisphaerica TaxID=252671 RepID=A0A7M5VH00_9CNID